MPEISVVIPAHNEEKYIRKTLRSLKNQTFQDFEIIVVTNGCTDKTQEIVKSRVGKNLRHLNLAGANVSRARNYGAGKAKGKLLVFLDADTILDKNALHTIKEKFKDHHGVGTTRVKPDNTALKYKFAMGFKNTVNRTGIYQGCSGVLICRRKDFDGVNGYDPNIHVKEHRILTQKLMKKGRYICLPTHATTSMRRFNEWSLTQSGLFWIAQWVNHKRGKLHEVQYEKIR